MIPLSQQFMGFGLAIALGILIGILFDFYRISNCLLRPPIMVTRISDLLFWLLMTAVVFYSLLLGNWGEVRAYIILGLIFGLIIHVRCFSQTLLRLANRFFRFLGHLVKTLARPFTWGNRFLRRVK